MSHRERAWWMGGMAALSVCLCLCMILGPLGALSLPAASLRYGDSGTLVSQMQQKLRQWGYYSGSVDGVFGSDTLSAVKYFQRNNGLTADGVVGPATAAKLGLTLSASTSTDTSSRGERSDVYLLGKLVHSEARGEPYTGQVAVAAVVLNRMRSASFPNTMAGVIYQPGAFTAVSDGQINLAPNAQCLQAAQDALNGWDPSGGALYYYNPAKTTSSWIYSRTVITVIGQHYFAR